MKVLALMGSPRGGGNTEVLLDAVLRGAVSAGGEVDLVRLCDLDFGPCVNCGGCDDTGVCILEDDMTPLYDRVLAAERIIFAAPIYFYGVPAQAKAFIDRTQSLWCRKRLLQDKGLWQDLPGRKGFFVSVAATQGKRLFEGSILAVKYTCAAIGIAYGGDFLVRGVEGRGDMVKSAQDMIKAEEAGKNFML